MEVCTLLTITLKLTFKILQPILTCAKNVMVFVPHLLVAGDAPASRWLMNVVSFLEGLRS
jgi:hypothetical protein